MDLFFQGGAGDLFLSEDSSAEERIKSLLGDAADRGRRRIVRRPLGSGGYGSQALVFAERDRDGGSSSPGGDPLSELLAHLAASRKSGDPARAREAAAGLGGGGLGGLAQIAAEESQRRGLRLNLPEANSAATVERRHLRARFVQELVVSAMVDEPTIGETLGGVAKASAGESLTTN